MLSKALLSLSSQQACTPPFRLQTLVSGRHMRHRRFDWHHRTRDSRVVSRITLSQFRSTLGIFTSSSSLASLHHSRHSRRAASFSSTSHPYFIRLRICRMILLLIENGRRSPHGSHAENAWLKTFLFVMLGLHLSPVNLSVFS